MSIFVKNWARFQHFKDRKPPWIKLYRDILDDKKWHDLDAESAKILVSLWLIASEDENKAGELPSAAELAFRLRLSEKSIKSSVSKLGHWLRQDDISAISDLNKISARYQDNRPETETETETYKPEKEGETNVVANSPNEKPWLPITAWNDFKQHRKEIKKALTPKGEEKILAQLQKWSVEGHDISEIINNTVMNGYQGLFLPTQKRANGSLAKRNESASEEFQRRVLEQQEKDITP